MEPEQQNTNFDSVTLQPDVEELPVPTQLTLGYSPKMAKAHLVGLSTATCRLQQPWSSSHLTNKRVCNCRSLTDQPFLPINGQVIPYRTWYETIFALLGVSMIATITMYTTVANTGGSYENLKTKSSSEVDENKNLFKTGKLKLECRTNIYEECTVGPGYRNIVL